MFAGLAVALLVTAAVPLAAGGWTVVDGRIDGPVRPSAAPGRGPARQVTPTLPPPIDDWRDGSVTGCTPGQLVRGVDTGGKKLITFTFDDGPDTRYTPIVMDEFEKRGMTATFFIVGTVLRVNDDLGREIVRRGFAVGNHSVTHRYSSSVIAAEVPTMNRIILEELGVRTPYFRAPGLTEGSSIGVALRYSGQCNLSTTVDLKDWISPRRNRYQLCSSFTASVHPGQIVLLHDGGSHLETAMAVGCMLDAATKAGYRVVSLAELLDAGTAYGYRSRAERRASRSIGE
jgi:peptidoglycan/xylan/chitin deacetylase (PgdA/CDA1 family)